MKLARLFAVVCVCAAVWAGLAAPPKNAAPPGAKSKATAKKSVTGKAGTKAKSATRRGRYRRSAKRAYSPPAQAAPTPDRVREIQQALVDRGYEAPVDGVWGKPTEAALAKFQSDQKIEGKGKLTALSILSLGLGPKRDAAAAAPAPENKP